ncbi:MAG: hypothetical protein Q9176_003347 [Flavoplaca citrina]
MASSSKYPSLLDFDEEEVDFAIANSLHDFRSTSDDEESTLDVSLRLPDTNHDRLPVDDADTLGPHSDPRSSLHTSATSRPSSASFRSSRARRALDGLYRTPNDRGRFPEEDPDQYSAHLPQPMGVDPLTEMQVLRARMDMLQSLIPPPTEHDVLENSDMEDEQISPYIHGLDQTSTTQDRARDYLFSESTTCVPSAQHSLRNSFPRPAAIHPRAFFTGDHSALQSRRPLRREVYAPTHQQSNTVSAPAPSTSLEPPNRHPRARALGTSHLQQQTVLYYHNPLSGAKFVSRQVLSSPSVLYASKQFSKEPKVPTAGSLHPGQISLPLPIISPSTVIQASAPVLTKRRRVMPKSDLSLVSEQSLPSHWDIASSAYHRDDTFHSQNLNVTASLRQVPVLSSVPSLVPTYPVCPFMPNANIVFLSQLLPKSFAPLKRAQVIFAIRAKAPYVPLCTVEWGSSTAMPEPVRGISELILDSSIEQDPSFQHPIGSSKHTLDSSIRQERYFQHPLGPSGAGWPTSAYSIGEHPQALPVEIFELVGSFLPRDSIQNMRLVNREFERKISCLAFKSVVVPFKPKIYETAGRQMSAKAMSKLKEPIGDGYNARENHVQDGMRVFEQWGPEIKRFALTFEVAEENLTKLKPKRRFEVTKSFWGSYRWPHQYYNRFEQAAKLEQKADEASAMTTAFSKLTGVREFGLSILSGLGWLSGKDLSDRARLFRKKPTIFGPQYALPDRELRENIEKWEATTRMETAASKRIQNKAARSFFHATREFSPVDNLPRLTFRNTLSENLPIFPPLMFDNENLEAKDLSRTDVVREDEAVITILGAYPTSCEPSVVIPHFLSPEQEDWLMEMEWAQEAFLSSWCIALLDNPSVFHSLRTFNVANVSSKHLLSLQRDDIWGALPSLQNLTVLVSPDWRRVSKDNQGNVFTEEIRPSSAQTVFWNFLSALFRESRNGQIKSLTIGYVDGGEHATGMYARNQNILPAPIDHYPFLNPSNTPQKTLHLPAVEELVMINCWLTPATLRNFFSTGNAPNLKRATFNSVSLTANTSVKSLHNDDNDEYILPSTDPSLKWLTTNPLAGSWPDIINTITPGSTIADARYIHGLLSSPPSPPPASHKNLASVHFNSCGYVRLPNLKEFDQSSLPELPLGPPQCLKRRWTELQKGMLDGKEDGLLGTVVPCMRDEEEGALKGVWGFEFGWQGEWEGRGWECREDGQPEGGSGRFSGSVKRSNDLRQVLD